MLEKLKSYWFTPIPAERLAILRIASGLFALWYFATRYDLMANLGQSGKGNFEPVGLVWWMAEPIPQGIWVGLIWVALLCGVGFVLGWRYRFTGPLFAFLSLLVFSYRYSWSMIYHDNIALVLHLLVIGISPAAAALSLDARKHTSGFGGADWQYGWPVRLLCAATAATYFVSGMAKVLGELAWGWTDGTALRSQVAVDALRKELLGESASPFFYWLYAHKEVFLFMGLFALVVELGAPLALFWRRSRVAWALATWAMHWGIWLVMGITFRHQLTGLIFLPFFAVEKSLPWLRRTWVRLAHIQKGSKAQAQHPTVLFDGVCNFCNATVRFIAERDPKGRFRFASQQSAIGEQMLRERGVAADLSSIVVVEGEHVYRNSDAVLHIARHLRGLWPLLYVLALVPRPLRDAAYKWFAKHRYRWFGMSDGACPIPAPAIRKRFLS